MESPSIATFGLFEADLQSGELWKAGKRIKIKSQPPKVLSILLEHPGELQLRLWKVRLPLLLSFALVFSGVYHSPASAQNPAGSPSTAQRSHNIQVKTLPNGIQISAHGTILRITALRDDVLRVRAADNGRLPEDASWAVLPSSRTASIQTVPEITAGRMGFHTASLRVMCDAALRLTIADLAGKVLQQDSRSIEWHGHGFHIYKQKFADSHFFGLGDKPGPLDRAGKAFTMWNSDSFGWQESTDPIYKSIPYFIDYRQGRALGVLFDNTWRTYFDFGHKAPDQYSFGAPDGPVDYYLMYGPDPKHVVETYAWLTGPTPLPPLWSLGFQQSRYSYYPESRVIEIADRLRADHIPADALYLDIDYQDHNRPFTVDTAKFPHFSEMIHELAQMEFHSSHYRLTHREAARCQLRSLRHGHRWRSLCQKFRRHHLHRHRMARSLGLPRLHPPDYPPMVGNTLQWPTQRRRRWLLE